MAKRTLKSRLTLAIFPIIVVLAVLAVEYFSRQQILFTSLVSSVFLIYTKPDDAMNDTSVIIRSQVLAALIGYGCYALLGTTYWDAFIAVILCSVALVLLRTMHPPAIATSLIFAFRVHSVSNLELFGLLLVLIAILVVMKQTMSYLKLKL